MKTTGLKTKLNQDHSLVHLKPETSPSEHFPSFHGLAPLHSANSRYSVAL